MRGEKRCRCVTASHHTTCPLPASHPPAMLNTTKIGGGAVEDDRGTGGSKGGWEMETRGRGTLKRCKPNSGNQESGWGSIQCGGVVVEVNLGVGDGGWGLFCRPGGWGIYGDEGRGRYVIADGSVDFGRIVKSCLKVGRPWTKRLVGSRAGGEEKKKRRRGRRVKKEEKQKRRGWGGAEEDAEELGYRNRSRRRRREYCRSSQQETSAHHCWSEEEKFGNTGRTHLGAQSGARSRIPTSGSAESEATDSMEYGIDFSGLEEDEEDDAQVAGKLLGE
eukprot:763230-Hanusia_phi.AAC.6